MDGLLSFSFLCPSKTMTNFLLVGGWFCQALRKNEAEMKLWVSFGVEE